ncbi:MAG: sigma-70 family RNA polymerase sigma factor [Bacteroidales bacterium]|nr:sigma-70 family RNA polymerase sigma factor [Bacteroidales bacterium]
MTTNAFLTDLLGIRPRLLNFAYRLTSDHDDAHDLLQDTTLKMLCNQSKFVEQSNFKGWAMTIMKNLFINHYRKESKKLVVDSAADNEALMDLVKSKETTETPDSALSKKEIIHLVNQLPESIRSTFALYLKGFAYQEIADRQDLPIGTVKSRIFIAKKRLQQQLADYR